MGLICARVSTIRPSRMRVCTASSEIMALSSGNRCTPSPAQVYGLSLFHERRQTLPGILCVEERFDQLALQRQRFPQRKVSALVHRLLDLPDRRACTRGQLVRAGFRLFKQLVGWEEL